MRIGIFGGSFDPIHTGHAMIANYASQREDLDEVWLMVSPLNPLKKDSGLSDENTRFDMAEIVARDCAYVSVSRFEQTLPIPSYTYNTLCRLREAFPMHTFSLIIGSDNWVNFDKWRDNERIVEEFSILIYPRPGYYIDEKSLPGSVRVMEDAPQALISSTAIRKMVKERKNVNFLVPPQVYEYIKEHKLYLDD